MSENAARIQIVTSRRIVTMDDDRGTAPPEAFACHGEWITATGTLAQLRQRYPAATVRDFDGATIVPGFNDAHQHPTICAEQLLQLDLSPSAAPDLDRLTEALRRRAATAESGEWIVGCGYDEARSNPDGELTRAELDAACPASPVLVVSVTLHSGVLNTEGLRCAGLSTPDDAPAGGEIGHDAAGRLTGVVHDQALYDLAFPAFTRRDTVVKPPGVADLTEAFGTFTTRLNAAGITSVGDAAIGPHSWRMLDAARSGAGLSVRVNALPTYEHLEHFLPIAKRATAAEDRLRVGGIKAFADGAVNGGACLVEEPVVGATGHGNPRMPADELAAVIARVHDAGLRIAVHANGDRAIRYVLDGVRAAQLHNPRADVRHRIEHTSIVNAAVLAGMAELDIVAVPFGQYATAHGDKLRAYYESERIERMFAHRSMIEHGIHVAGSSDYPCGPFEPLFAMRSCVTRLDRDDQPFGASQRIPARDALALYTTGAAYASAEERTKGKIAAGHLADFVVLDADPLAVDGSELADIPVRQTWLGGTPVWTTDGS